MARVPICAGEGVRSADRFHSPLPEPGQMLLPLQRLAALNHSAVRAVFCIVGQPGAGGGRHREASPYTYPPHKQRHDFTKEVIPARLG